MESVQDIERNPEDEDYIPIDLINNLNVSKSHLASVMMSNWIEESRTLIARLDLCIKKEISNCNPPSLLRTISENPRI